MELYVGLDVSLKETSICVVDGKGEIVSEGTVISEPAAIAEFIKAKAEGAKRIGLETGPTTTWPGLVIMGRTSAAAITGIDDAIARARAYQETGVDAVFFAGMKTRDQLTAIAAEIDIPIMLGGAGAELSDRAFLAENGVRIALQGHLPFSAGVGAVYETLKALRDGTAPADISHAGSRELMARVLREDDYDRWTDEYLGDGG